MMKAIEVGLGIVCLSIGFTLLSAAVILGIGAIFGGLSNQGKDGEKEGKSEE